MKILLVDLSGLFWRMWHATHDRRAYNKVLAALNKHFHSYDKVAACLDGPPYVRSEWYPEYKANRPEKPDGAVLMLEELTEAVTLDNGFKTFVCEGWEADDIIATLANAYKTEDVTILSADKDLQQCCALSDTVKWLSPKEGEKPVTADDIPNLHHGVTAKDYTLFKALTGDSSDNIPGVKGCGPSMASAVVDRVFGNIEVLIDSLKRDPESLPRHSVFALPGDIDNIQLWYKLVSLNYDLPIDTSRLKMTEITMDLDVPEMVDELPTKVKGEAESASTPEGTMIVPAATIEGRNWRNALEPVDTATAQGTAVTLFNSRLFSNFNSPEAAFAAIMAGRELGIGAVTALNTIYVVQGRPTIKTEMMIALVYKSGKATYLKLIESSLQSATVKAHRKDDPDPDPTTVTFTMDDAKRLGLAGRDQWRKQPETMLVYRAYSKLIRRLFPDVIAGFLTTEEANDV